METDRSPITVPVLQQMKRDGRKIAGVPAWDYIQMARVVDRAGALGRQKKCRGIPHEKLRGAKDTLRLHHPNARNTGARRGPRLRGLCVPAKPQLCWPRKAHPVGSLFAEDGEFAGGKSRNATSEERKCRRSAQNDTIC